MSKAKLSPIRKKISVPRLELQGAVLGAKLKSYVQDNLNLNISKFYFWSDRKVVLAWINSNYDHYQPFVSHRIATIQNLTNVSDWNWVNSKNNVADDATKFHSNFKIDWEGEWLKGPKFLHNLNHECVSKSFQLNESDQSQKDFEKKSRVCMIRHQDTFIDFNKFSTFRKLKRVL